MAMVLLSSAILLVPRVRAADNSLVIYIKGISCPFCVYGVEKQLQKVPGVVSVTTNYKAATATIEKDPKAPIDLQALEKAVQRAGFSVDRIELTLQGRPYEWEGKPGFKEESTGQVFLLVEPGEKGHHDNLDPKKWETIRGWSRMQVVGEGHFHVGLPPALSVRSYQRTPQRTQ